MQALTLQDLTLQDVLQFVNQQTMSAKKDSNQTKATIKTMPKKATNKRIGLMKIDPKVYECLEKDSMEFFQ